MRVMAFSVFDVKVKAFNRPFFCENIPVAIRSFSDAVNDTQTGLNKHPEDYNLYKIGEFDDNTAELIAEKQPVFVAKALDFVPVK